MKRFFLLLTAAFAATYSPAFADQRVIETDKVIVGKPTGANPGIDFRGTTNKFRANRSTGNLEFTHDGSSWKAIGSGGGGGNGGVNLLTNFDLEAGITANFTASDGGTVTLRNNGDQLFGANSARFVATSSGQTYTSDGYLVPEGLKGAPCLAGLMYNTAEDTNKYKIRVLDGDGDLLAESSLDPTGGITIPGYVGFTCPLSGDTDDLTIKVQIYSTASALGIDMDDFHLGSENRSAHVSQATFVGSGYFNTSSCTWSTTSAVLAAFNSDSNCVGPVVETNPGPGVIQTTDADLPQFTVNNLPPGTYKVTFIAGTAGNSSVDGSTLAINDGTTTAGHATASSANVYLPSTVVGYFSYSATGNRTFALWGSIPSTTFYINTGASLRVWFSIERYPNAEETAFRLDKVGWRVDANIAGANPSLGTSAVTSYAELTHGSLVLTNNSGNGAIAAQIACASGTAPTGTTCSGANESVGIAFNVPSAGDVLACASFGYAGSVGTSGQVNVAFQLAETTTTSPAIVQAGKSRPDFSLNSPATGTTSFGAPFRVCGTFSFATAGQKVIRLLYEQKVSGTVSGSIINLDGDADIGARDLHWEVYPLNYISGAMPIYKGMVTSSSNGRVKTVDAHLTCSNAASVVVNGDGGVASMSNGGGAGLCTANFASGAFSGAPYSCTCTIIGAASTSGSGCWSVSAASSSSISLTRARNGSAENGDIYLSCRGPN